jgi:hypothetical protein
MSQGGGPSGFAPNQADFLKLEAQSVWDRHKQLQEKNKTIMETVLKLYSFLLIFAAAPFTREGVLETGFSRVWGFGGVWLALAAWIYSDRSFRAYGGHLLEQVFCIRQIAQIREMIMSSSLTYSMLSLLPPSRTKSTKLSHISSSQILYTAYFYKVLSFFTPMYLCLFLCMILFPAVMLNPQIHVTRSIYARVSLGFSVVFFFWLGSSMKRCYGLQREAFRARRISPENFWPDFPEEDQLHPVPATKGEDRWNRFIRHLRTYWWSWRKWANWLLGGVCYVLAILDLALFVQRLIGAPSGLAVPSVLGNAGSGLDVALRAYWWRPEEFTLLWCTIIIFVIRFAFLEVDLRTVLKIAAENVPVRPSALTVSQSTTAGQ